MQLSTCSDHVLRVFANRACVYPLVVLPGFICGYIAKRATKVFLKYLSSRVMSTSCGRRKWLKMRVECSAPPTVWLLPLVFLNIASEAWSH